jgi:hypothetical protein
MQGKQRREHWDQVYREKSPTRTSWFQPEPSLSLALIQGAGIGLNAAIIDVGGGESVLVDCLLDRGFNQLTVLDISAVALDRVRQRLPADSPVQWIVADITDFEPSTRFSLWHDRAVFHFLTDSEDRAAYKAALEQGLAPGAQLVIGTFALDGPERCSGLEVVRYDADSLGRELGPGFELLDQEDEVHTTPWGTQQKFCFFRYRYHAGETPR